MPTKTVGSTTRLTRHHPPHSREDEVTSVQTSTSRSPLLPSSPVLRPSPRSASPTRSRSSSPSRFMKKLSKWKGRDDLDFGCAGEHVDDQGWAGDGPSDLSDRYYSSHHGMKRASVSSSIPSLTHSRAHSSSSDLSTSTVESSLPPSPKPSSSPFAPPLPYTSRVPLTPRTSERKRKTEEVAAIDALNEYFTRVRLSRVEEDVASAAPSRGESPSRQPVPTVHHLGGGLEINLLDTGRSTYSSFPGPNSPDSPEQGFSPFLSLPVSPRSSSSRFAQLSDSGHSNSSAQTIMPGQSPVPDSEISGTLEELSEYFNKPPLVSPTESTFSSRSLPPLPSTYSTSPTASHGRSYSSTDSFSSYRHDSRRESRPRFGSQGHIPQPPLPPPKANPLAERRVSYGWI
ncbi:hypothetical protein T439DRAFT_133871 [Meredithblackwellia eburnea MCA 4105]